ncbi:MAG TPA: cell division protein ZapA [Pelagibacterales bacterium]|jgi:DNA repair exonuclease SbcCD ATPase subunit|nr:cell division protein ZapA [Pelagibacterales bacterium]
MSTMPTLKTEILGSIIEINYQEAEKEKLERLISKLRGRISEFNHNIGQISDSKIIFLAALKAEDHLEEIENLLEKKDKEKKISNDQKNIINNLTKEIISLKDQISKLESHKSSYEEIDFKTLKNINTIEDHLDKILHKILATNKNGS